ncbi:MAG: helix-turn-helix domain-containing protein [Deltaproteobacteria bacterium]|jgi:excisionase family DNA binding protein|nr:helix-turn-helix domain-containing protein [Deltaproteobacteria bacterium]
MILKKNQDIKILTVQEVADLLRVHRSTVSRFAQSGELDSYLIGTRRLFKESDVLAFFEKQKASVCVVSGKEN